MLCHYTKGSCSVLISGDGVTAQYSVQIKPNFRVRTEPALKWIQLTSGNFEAVDRGASEDRYLCDVRIYGIKNMVNEFITEFESNRGASTTPHVLNLSGFNSTEHIFGADLDYTQTVPCTVVDIGKRVQKTWRGYSLKMRIYALSTIFQDISPAMPSLELLKIGYHGDSNYTLNKIENYDGSYTYLDHKADIGLFRGVFTFTDSEAALFRRYVATQRGATIPLNTINGVGKPFGIKRGGSYPYDAKIISWRERGMFGVHKWQFEITFAEVA